MGFCTSCGATLEAGKPFCTSCGAAVKAPAPSASAPAGAAAAAAPAPVAAQPAKQGGGALKIVLIVLGILFLLFVIVGGAIGYFIYRGYQHAKAGLENATITSSTEGGKASIETPWGNMEASHSEDAGKVLESIGVEPYPGATVVEGSVATASFGKMATAGAKFTTPDAPAQVFDFYKGKHHGAMTTGSGDQYSLMFGNKDKAMVTIVIHPADGGTEIEIGSVAGAGGSVPHGTTEN